MIPTVPLPCPIQVVAPTSDVTWSSAASAATAHLSEALGRGTDCQSILLEVHGARAILSLRTADGRRAVRPLTAPAELAPLVEALLTTLPAAPIVDDPKAQPVAEGRPVTPPPDTRPASSARVGERTPMWLVYLAGAGRLGMSDWVGATPSASLAVGGVFERWECGVGGETDFTYAPLTGSKPSGFSLRTYGVDTFVGYRPRLGPIVGVLGADAGASFVDEAMTSLGSAMQGMHTGSQDAAVVSVHYRPVQFDLGSYVGVVVPITRTIRVRTQLDARYVGMRFAAPPSGVSWPSLPTWDASLSLGVEGVGP